MASTASCSPRSTTPWAWIPQGLTLGRWSHLTWSVAEGWFFKGTRNRKKHLKFVIKKWFLGISVVTPQHQLIILQSQSRIETETWGWENPAHASWRFATTALSSRTPRFGRMAGFCGWLDGALLYRAPIWRVLAHPNLAPLRFDWFFFDAEGEVKKPDFTPDPKKPAAASM